MRGILSPSAPSVQCIPQPVPGAPLSHAYKALAQALLDSGAEQWLPVIHEIQGLCGECRILGEPRDVETFYDRQAANMRRDDRWPWEGGA